jgi:hypothetical protein
MHGEISPQDVQITVSWGVNRAGYYPPGRVGHPPGGGRAASGRVRQNRNGLAKAKRPVLPDRFAFVGPFRFCQIVRSSRTVSLLPDPPGGSPGGWLSRRPAF